jgi:hypothetical protein
LALLGEGIVRIGTTETVRQIVEALEERRPFSLVRLCDGEMRAMQDMEAGRMPDGRGARQGVLPPGPVPGHDVPFTAEVVDAEWTLFRQGLQGADILGLGPWPPAGENVYPALKELLRPVVCLKCAVLADTYVTSYMVCGGELWGLLEGQRILIIGPQPGMLVEAVETQRYSDAFRHFGIAKHPPWDIVGTMRTDCAIEAPGDWRYKESGPAPVWRPTSEYLDEAAAHDFDIALVGFGWRAAALCPALAERTGKVVLDMGHVLRELWYPRRDWERVESWGGIMERAREASHANGEG